MAGVVVRPREPSFLENIATQLAGNLIAEMSDRTLKANETNQYRKKMAADEEYDIRSDQRDAEAAAAKLADERAYSEAQRQAALDVIKSTHNPSDPASVNQYLATQNVYGVPNVENTYKVAYPDQDFKSIDAGGQIMTGSYNPRSAQFTPQGSIQKSVTPDRVYAEGAQDRRNRFNQGQANYRTHYTQNAIADRVGATGARANGRNYDFEYMMDLATSAEDAGEYDTAALYRQAAQELLYPSQPQGGGGQQPGAVPQQPGAPALTREQKQAMGIPFELVPKVMKEYNTDEAGAWQILEQQDYLIPEHWSAGYQAPTGPQIAVPDSWTPPPGMKPPVSRPGTLPGVPYPLPEDTVSAPPPSTEAGGYTGDSNIYAGTQNPSFLDILRQIGVIQPGHPRY